MEVDLSLKGLIEEAIEMEMEGAEFYGKLRDQCRDHRVEEIFKLLLEDEADHIMIFEDLLRTFTDGTTVSDSHNLRLRRCGIFEDVKAEFEKDKIHQKMLFSEGCRIGAAEAMHLAIEGEKKAIDHLRDIFEKMEEMGETDEDHLNLIRLILTQEIMHLHFLEKQNIYLKRDGYWFDVKEFREFRRFTMESLKQDLDAIYQEAVAMTKIPERAQGWGIWTLDTPRRRG